MHMKTRSMTKAFRISKTSTMEVASIIASMTSKTDKNNKLKKRKIQQTRHRKVDRALKTQALTEDLKEGFTEECTENFTEDSISFIQVSQITYKGYTYQLLWDNFTKKALLEIPANDFIYYNNVVIYDNIPFVEYEDVVIIDIIYQHFGIVHIIPNDTSNILSSDSLYTLVSSIPLTQYTLIDQSYDCRSLSDSE